MESLQELIDGFARAEDIKEIIILGVNGGVRRIIMEEKE